MGLCLHCKWWNSALIKLGLDKHMPIVMHNRRCLYYQNNYSSKIEKLVNIQIQAEQQAGQDYLQMAVNFLHPSKACLGAGGFFMKMYKEELGHMEKFIQYQLLRGGTTLINGIEPPTQNINLSLLDAFKVGLCMEKRITELLEEGVRQAEEVKDYQYADFITSVFLAEQMQSIHEIANHVTKLTALNNNEYGLYLYDLELEKMYPYSVKV